MRARRIAIALGLALPGTMTARAVAAPFAFVVGTGPNEVAVINAATNTVVDHIAIDAVPARGPLAIAIAPGATTAYVTSANDNVVAILDVPTHAVLGAIPVGGGPNVVAFTPDGRTAYVGNQRDATLSV